MIGRNQLASKEHPTVRRTSRLPITNSLYALAFLVLALTSPLGAVAVKLNPVGSVKLAKEAGQIDSVVEGQAGTLLVRDYSWRTHESHQRLEVYEEASGKQLRTIGRAGRQPGRFVRLKDVWVTHDGAVWIADLIGRLLHFSPSGELRHTRLIENPGYRVKAIVVDEKHGALYLAGCLPLKTYLNEGCSLVHRYSYPELSYQQSFLATDPLAIERRYHPLEDFDLDLDSSGKLWFIDRPIFKLFRVDPENGASVSFPLTSPRFKKPAAIPPRTPSTENERRRRESYLIDRVLVVEPWVAVSVRHPEGHGYSLAIFDLEGNELSQHLKSPGRLVGKTRQGELIFHQSEAKNFVLQFFKLAKRPATSDG